MIVDFYAGGRGRQKRGKLSRGAVWNVIPHFWSSTLREEFSSWAPIDCWQTELIFRKIFIKEIVNRGGLTVVLLRHFLDPSFKWRLLQPLPGFLFWTLYVLLCLLPMYSYGSLPFFDTNICTIRLCMTSLWRHNVSAPSNLWTYSQYRNKCFFPKNYRNMQFSWYFWQKR